MQLTKEIINVSWLDTTDGGVSSIDTGALVVEVQQTQVARHKWWEFNRQKSGKIFIDTSGESSIDTCGGSSIDTKVARV